MFQFLRKTILTILLSAFASQANAMWIQADTLDPTMIGVGTNRYAYSNNDPINKLDQNGNFFAEIGALLGGILDGFSQTVTTGGLVPNYAPNAGAAAQIGLHMDSALGIGAAATVMNSPGIGHNGGPSIDDNDDKLTNGGPNGGPNGSGPILAIAAAAAISTANPDKGQSPTPRSFYEQLVFEQIKSNPSIGKPLPNLNNDPNFSASNGWQKMEYTSRTSLGSITAHYQVNTSLMSGTAFDLKIVNNSGLINQ